LNGPSKRALVPTRASIGNTTTNNQNNYNNPGITDTLYTIAAKLDSVAMEPLLSYYKRNNAGSVQLTP
jgi:hypothetical protein